MNQILCENKENSKTSDFSKNKLRKKSMFFKFQFITCSILSFLVLLYYSYVLYENNKKEQLSKKLLNNFNISTLYSSNEDYLATRALNNNMYISDGTNFSVIGLIEIKKIRINYPIISSYNDDLLKIAPCRFLGPLPNEVGNLCIAGHNYNSYKFFSRLKELSIDDVISIYDLSRKENRLFGI